MDGTKRTIRLRIALAGIALTMGSLGLGATHAQTADAATAPAKAAAAKEGPRFVASAPQDFESSFATFEAEGAPSITVAPGAVDITAIEPAEPEGRSIGIGVASFYGKRFAGRPTASGERFDPRQLTAAHKTLPFGTRVKVINPRNGRSVIVRINDRGPFTKGRHIDLSRAAAEEIGLVNAGHGKVELLVIES
jgi:rare lipoprotein A